MSTEEAGLYWVEIPTRSVKPSQTCHGCGVQVKKTLSERIHHCDCGASCSRDENSAKVMLNWALFGNPSGQELAEVWSGDNAVLKHETHSIMLSESPRLHLEIQGGNSYNLTKLTLITF